MARLRKMPESLVYVCAQLRIETNYKPKCRNIWLLISVIQKRCNDSSIRSLSNTPHTWRINRRINKNQKLPLPPHLPPTPRAASGLVCYFRLFPGLRAPLARFTPGYRLPPSGLGNSARIRSQVPTLWRHLPPPQSRYGTAVISLVPQAQISLRRQAQSRCSPRRRTIS